MTESARTSTTTVNRPTTPKAATRTRVETGNETKGASGTERGIRKGKKTERETERRQENEILTETKRETERNEETKKENDTKTGMRGRKVERVAIARCVCSKYSRHFPFTVYVLLKRLITGV